MLEAVEVSWLFSITISGVSDEGNIFSLIPGTPKHVPITTTVPNAPHKNGNNTPFEKPTFAFSLWEFIAVYVVPRCWKVSDYCF